MIVIGLTGSIATGKSFVARCFAKQGAAIFYADKAVHDILSTDIDGIELIKQSFPEAFTNNKIDRNKLGKIVFNNTIKRKHLEDIIHPLVFKRRKEFLANARKNNEKIAVLEIPLLIETKGQVNCDYVIVTTVDAFTQEKRALKRKGMTKEKFHSINNLQLGSAEKIKQADFVIDTSVSEFAVEKEVKKILNKINKHNNA